MEILIQIYRFIQSKGRPKSGEAHCLKINDTETGEVSGRVPKVLRQKDDTERMEA